MKHFELSDGIDTSPKKTESVSTSDPKGRKESKDEQEPKQKCDPKAYSQNDDRKSVWEEEGGEGEGIRNTPNNPPHHYSDT